VEAHLAGCETCLAAVTEAAGASTEALAPVDETLLTRLRGAVAAELDRARPAAPVRNAPAWIGLAAALALTCAAGFLLGGFVASGGIALARAAAEDAPLDLSDPLVEGPQP
jgi:anti-sigma factor RsiW